MMSKVLLALAAFGLLTSSVFSGMVCAGILRFVRGRKRSEVAARHPWTPPVSLFKPLHGAEPNLDAHLASFFEQDYPAPFEILFCTRTLDDPGIKIAREVAARYPHVPAQFLCIKGQPYVNAKVSSLQRMEQEASHDIFIISDSDVRVTRDYIQSIANDFRDPEVGAVTCLYRGLADDGLWAKIEAAGMSVEMTAGVLAADLVEGMQFLLGPTMAARREAVQKMGGFGRLGPYCSDDFLLGNWVAGLGYKVLLSRHVIDHIVLNITFLNSMKHQVRWMKSTRFSRPKGHFGTGLTFSLPYGILGLFAGLAAHHPLLGLALFLYSIANRMGLAFLVGRAVVDERSLLRTCILYPVRDLMGFFFWLFSYSGGTILWRGQLYRLGEHGLMQSAQD